MNFKPHFLSISTRLIALAYSTLLISGCSSHINKVTPKNLKPMDQIYDEKTGGASSEALRHRAAEIQARPAASEGMNQLPPSMQYIRELYPKLPNPDLFMYVKPHVMGASGAVVPGYYTQFTLYEKIPYALPNETLGSIAPTMQRIEREQAAKEKSAAKSKKHTAGDKYSH
jgi:conjugative transfer region lipoprotein (TIGR03751 family)